MTDLHPTVNLQNIGCPACGAPRLGVVEGKRLACSYCGAEFVIAETVCPACATLNQPGTAYCTQCGTAISRMCAACGTRNWANAECCEHCGRPLDVIEDLSARWARSTQRRLQDQMDGASSIKRQEVASADARRRALWDVEQRRQAELAEASAARERQERRLVTIAVVAFVALVAIVALATLIQAGIR